MNTRKSIFALFLGWSGATVLLTAYFLTLFGVVDLRYINSLKLHWLIEYSLSLFLISCNLLFIILQMKIHKLKEVCLYLSFSVLALIIAGFLPYNFYIIFQSVLIPIVLIVAILIFKFKTEIKYKIKILIYCHISLFVLQQLLSFVKTGHFSVNSDELTILTKVICSADLFLIYIFILKGCDQIEYVLEYMVLSKLKSIFKYEKPSKESLDTSDLNARQKALFAVLVLGYQLFQMAVVLAIGFINNMFIELLVMLLIFWIGRTILQKSWHSDKLWICSVATFSGFYILTKITPPFEISLFLVVALTGAFIYILHILGVKADRLEELEEKYETDFTKYGLSAEMAKFAYDYKVNKLSIKQQVEITGLTEQVVKNYRSKVNKALTNYKE